MFNIYLLLAGFGLFQIENVFFLLLLVLKPFNIIMYKIYYDPESYGNMINIIDKESYLSGASLVRSRKIPTGFFFSKHAVGFIERPLHHTLNEFNVTIITTMKYYEYLTKREDIVFMENTETQIVPKSSTTVKVYQRYGSYSDFGYNSLKLSLKGLTALSEQQPIVDSIISQYKQRNRATVFIDGVPCSGKSSIGYLLAKEIGGVYSHSFNPTDPGDTFSYLISRIRQDEDDVPIIVVIEEIDIILTKIHNDTLILNNQVPTSVKDKSSWTSFLDDMFFYQNVIVVLTSNKHKEDIDKLDPAYLRRGRIHEYYRMNTPIIM